jgi:hypothetical protein
MDEFEDTGRASGQGWPMGEVRPARYGWMHGVCLEILYENLLRDLREEEAVEVEDDCY